MAKAKEKSSTPAAAESNGNGAAGNPDTGQLLDKETLDDLAVLDLNPGGPTPSKSILKLSSYKKEIANQFNQEEEIVFSVHARCEFVGFGGPKRIQEFDVLDIFQDDDLDEDLVERFKDRLETWSGPAKNKAIIAEFLDSCLEPPKEGESEGEDANDESPAAEAAEAISNEDTAALAVPDEAEAKAEAADEEPLDLTADGAESEIEGGEEVVDAEVVEDDDVSLEDPEAVAMEEAAGDLDWS